MGKSKFTISQLRASLASCEEELRIARVDTSGGCYNITDKDPVTAFRRFVAQTRSLMGATNMEYRMPDGTVGKFVCIEDARNRVAQAEKRGAKE